jgi:Peptidase family C25
MRTVRRFFALVLVVCSLAGSRITLSQVLRVNTLSDDGLTASLEFRADWKLPLAAAIDSSGIQEWTEETFDRFVAGFDEMSETISLGTLQTPRVTVVQSEYDEVRVNVSSTKWNRTLQRAEAVGIGMYRKVPTASVSVPIYTLDAETGILRRYRRVQVAVSRQVQVQPFSLAGKRSSNPQTQIDRSVLADGTIFQIRITEDGVYRIDRGFLTGLGLNPDTIEPDNLQLFGNGGRPVPALNGEARFADLNEIAVFVRGGGDGRFDDGDVLLFYGTGPRGWNYVNGSWEHFVHPFANENSYFLKVGLDTGKRIQTGSFPDYSDANVSSNTEGRFFTDLEEQVWSREHGSGLDWMSQTIRSGGVREVYTGLRVPGLMSGQITYEARVAIASNPRATITFESSGVVLGQLTAPSITTRGAEQNSASTATFSFTENVSGGQPLDLSMRLLSQINEPEAAVDWVEFFYDQNLVAENDIVRFSSRQGRFGRLAYQMRGFSATPIVWDVTSPDAYSAMGVSARAGGVAEIQFDAPASGAPREFVAFTESVARTISVDAVAAVPNQNLHGITSFPDLVIMAAAPFLDAANRLAEHRRQDGLDVLVAERDQIYNEFSGGVPDMRAARDYFKFLYDRATDESQMLRYALFMGDGHYDFRGLSALQSQQNNWLFPFETETSTFTDGTYTSDDYFGLLDDDEGIWTYTNFFAVSRERVDIGVGRIPAQTPSEAEDVVDKILSYEDPNTFGPWRSLYTAVADDGPNGLAAQVNDADLHVQNIDQVTTLLEDGLFPEINIKKIYAESFERVFLNGFRIPGAKRAINAALNQGTLVFNYSGHGGPDGLAQEEIFTTEDAIALSNKDRLAIFVTATCSFGWWDLEDFQSGGEVLLLNPNGGTVALLTTVRLVYTSSNLTSLNAGLNRAINENLFEMDEDGLPSRLGDVLRRTKNTRVGLQGNSRKFSLLGDPSMRFGLPRNRVKVESLNTVPLSVTTGQMRALDRVDISGTVSASDGSPDTGFNGKVSLTVFDAERKVPLVLQRVMLTPYYRIREDLIWRGDVQATSGRFTASFVVPKDISYSNEPGRIAAYASSLTQDALGYSENFLVGGTSDNPPNDREGPQIRLFLNDSTFVSGGTVSANPELLVKLSDESGINTIGAGVGHEMLLVVDGQESAAQDISTGFVADRNSFQTGETRWKVQLSETGPHSLSVRAWDVLNNSSTAELSFSIANDEVLSVTNVYNYPNPMSQETRFVFEHNQTLGTPANVRVRIYTLNGQIIRTIDSEEALPGGVLNKGIIQIPWDGRDEDFDRVATGIYLYTLRVQVDSAEGDRQVSERVEKIAVIR